MTYRFELLTPETEETFGEGLNRIPEKPDTQ